MIRTWHGSCYACTCTTLDHQFQFAPPASSPGACAKGGRRSPLLASAATLNNPERPNSLPAGRRSLMGGCAIWRQTRAQGSVHALHISRAIRPSRHFIQRQTSRHGSAGAAAAAGYCRVEALAVGKTARSDLTGQGNVKTNCGRCFGTGRLFEQYGIGQRANAIHASVIHHRHQGRFQRFAKGQPSHFKFSASNALETSDGAKGSVPVQAGKLPPDRGGLPHVGHG